MAVLTLVKILWCGQGMTTLVEVYLDGEEKDSADALLLVDCGGNPSWGDPAVDYVAKKVLAKKNRQLDALVFSHQDDDHSNLLPKLGEKLAGQGVTLADVFCGGLGWERNKIRRVKDFLEIVGFKSDVLFAAPHLSHFKNVEKREDLKFWWQWGDVSIRALISGLETTGGPSVQKNSSSAVVAVDNGTHAVVLPGDATYQTMNAINTIPHVKALLPEVLGLEIPHHGALRTAVEGYKSGGNPEDFYYRIIDHFDTNLKPRAVVASAGPWNTHHHPVQEVMERFLSGLHPAPEHTYVSYVFLRPDGRQSQGWTQYSNVLWGAYSTIYAIGATEVASASAANKGVKERYGEFVFGDIVFRLGGEAALAPEEMVTFQPRGAIRPEAEPIYFAASPRGTS